MNRLLRLILVAILFITCYSCFWHHERGGHEDQNRGEHRDYYRLEPQEGE